MARTKSNISISIEPAEATLLSDLAKRHDISISSLARELIHEALAEREEINLSVVAASRDGEGVETVSHEDAWK